MVFRIPALLLVCVSLGRGSLSSLTAEPVGNIDLEFNITEEHGEGEGEVGLCSQGYMAVACLKSV